MYLCNIYNEFLATFKLLVFHYHINSIVFLYINIYIYCPESDMLVIHVSLASLLFFFSFFFETALLFVFKMNVNAEKDKHGTYSHLNLKNSLVMFVRICIFLDLEKYLLP